MALPILIVVDDDPGMCRLVRKVGENAGFEVRPALSAAEFQELWAECSPSAIVMDLVMPDMEGIELLGWLADQKCSTPIILASGFAGKYLDLAQKLGSAKGENIVGTLTKPFGAGELEMMLKEIIYTL